MRRASHLCTLGLFFALAHTTLSAQHATLSAPERLVTNSGPLELESIGDVRPPQILPPVPLANDRDALLFEWSKSEPATGMDLEYEFCLYLTEGANLSGSPVFRHAIRTNRLVYDSRFPLLLPGADYVAVVNLRLSNEREARVVDGISGAVVFHNIPRCTDPRNFRIASTGRNKVTLNWEGRAAEPRGVRYLVQYRTKNGRGDWQEILVEQGLSVSINGISARQAFEFRIRKLCDGTGKNAEFSSDWVGLQANAERIQLPPFTCGAQYTPPTCNIDPNDCPWQQVEIGDTLYIGGFPIQLDSVEVDSTLDANNDLVPYYSKMFGLAPLPFGNTAVRVELNYFGSARSLSSGICIDENKNICYGNMVGIRAESCLPVLEPAPAVFGADICQPPPSAPGFNEQGIHSVTGLPWDEHGFGPTGFYVKQPPYPGWDSTDVIDSLYDPNGFDVHGNHFQTGTPYGPNGCSQNGLTADQQSCNPGAGHIPYYWLQNPTGTEAGNEFAEIIEDSIGLWILQALQQFQLSYLDSVALQNTACNNIRGEMNNIVTSLNYDRTLLFGADDEYFEAGMWRRFSSRPEVMNGRYQRNSLQIILEEKHVDLYYCDKKADGLITFKHQVDSLLTAQPGSIADLKEAILDLVRNLDEDKVNLYEQNRAEFKKWLRSNLKPEIINLCDGFCSNAPKSKPDTRIGHSNVRQTRYPGSGAPIGRLDGNDLATNMVAQSGMDALLQSLEVTPKDIAFEFNQGFKEVNGVDRVWYLEAINKHREETARSASATSCDSFLMPIQVVNRASDGRKYEVWLDNIEFTPEIASLDAYILIEMPNSGQKVAFRALGVQFNPNGPSVNPLKLELVNDVSVRLSPNARLTLKGGLDHTFVAVDCSGFAGLGLEAEVEVCRNIVMPLNQSMDTLLPDPARVKARMNMFLPTLDEFYAEVSIDPFVITGVEDFKWQLDTAVLDFSSIRSVAQSPPPGYTSPFSTPTSFSPLWQGFYLKNLSVRFPNHFKKNGNNLQVGVQQVVIDPCGASGQVYATPLLSLSEGNADGWAFSVDSFKLTVLHNVPVNAGFRGLIHVPIISEGSNDCGDDDGPSNDRPISDASRNTSCNTNAPTANDCFIYSAFIEPGGGSPTYNFTVNTGGKCWCIDMMKAGKAIIEPNSSIEMEVKDGVFKTVATLHGRIIIGGALTSKTSVSLPEISFENLQISNKDPYFSPGAWSIPTSGNASIGGFGLTLSSINMIKTEDGKPALKFYTRVSFVNEGRVNLSAMGSFRIAGTLMDFNGRQRWVYNNWKIDDAEIRGSFPGVDTLAGFVKFYETDPVFGSGWRGGVLLKIKSLVEVSAVAQFGRTQTQNGIGYKYFFVDALACLDKGIPIVPGIDVIGFGGGVYYHMGRTTPVGGTFALPACGGTPTVTPTLGQSLSGILYAPDLTTWLGIKVTVAITAQGNREAFNGSATFGIEFNPTGSLKKILLQGNARFMEPFIITRAPNHAVPDDAAVAAALDVVYDFNNGALDGALDVRVNVDGILRGSGSDNSFCKAKIHFSRATWFIKMGTPQERNGLTLLLPNIGEIASIGSYIMIGKDLDPASDIPAEIRELVGNSQKGTLDGNIQPSSGRSLITNGNGFAFGMSFDIGSRQFSAGPLYATIKATLGFDISLLDYGPNAMCDETNEPVGINGWYASGQIYAGVWGGLGIKVKVFGQRREFQIFDLAAAAALKASMPNPFWAEGRVGGQYSVLGGLVKGKANFGFTIGQQCTIVGADDPNANLKLIQEITPSDSSSNVPVDVRPRIEFTFPMEQEFPLPDIHENNIKYVGRLDEVKMFYRNYDMGVSYEWSWDKQSMTLLPGWMLPNQDTVRIYIKVHVDSSGINIHTEEKWVTFTTGYGLKQIPPSNVKGSYPFDGQYNFYRKEIPNGRGYVLLDRGQPDLFWHDDYDYFIRFKESGATTVCEIPLIYKAFDEKIEFDLPPGNFTPNKIYRMEVIRRNRLLQPAPTFSGGEANRMDIGIGCGLEEKQSEILYTAFFRTSQFETFFSKITTWDTNKQAISYDGTERVIRAKASIEPFEDTEISGKCVSLSTDLSTNPILQWFTNNIRDLVYTFPNNAHIFSGQPPLDAIKFSREITYAPLKVTKENWISGTITPPTPSPMVLNYEILRRINLDFNTVKLNYTIAASQSYPTLNPALSNLTWFYGYNPIFPEPPNGSYRIAVRYRMPGYDDWYSSTHQVTVSK